MIKIQSHGLNVFPFSKEEADKFLSDFQLNKEILEVVKLPDSEYYLVYSNLENPGYFDKQGFFHSKIKIHI